MTSNVTFFRGRTLDGIRWVVSYEGGPTATAPRNKCRISGMIGHIRFNHLTTAQASELRAFLPTTYYADCEILLREIVRAKR